MAEAPINELSGLVIGAAIEVHRELGPGLLESAYQECLCRELALRNAEFEPQVRLPVRYKDILLDCGYLIDVLVDRRLVLELKAVESVTELHKAQLMTYMKLLDCQLGLLINFNVPKMIEGVTRISLGAPNLS